MTKAYTIGGARIVEITIENDAKCELCGTVAELRPYGPKGERICFACGMKDEPAAKCRFSQLLDGD